MMGIENNRVKAESMEPWIELSDVTYAYPGEETVPEETVPGTVAGGETVPRTVARRGLSLSHVNLQLYPGHTYVVTGPNGCGKSTLFRVLAGLSYPSAGRYVFRGEEITEKKMNSRTFSREFYKKLGFLFQNSETQLFCKTVREEVAFGLFQLGLSREEVEARTQEYLERLEITGLAGRAPFHLSGGEQKRVALAAVLAMQPPVLILDEPEAGLDEDGETWITDFLASLKSPRRLIVIATHSKALAGAVGGEGIHMNKNHTIVNCA